MVRLVAAITVLAVFAVACDSDSSDEPPTAVPATVAATAPATDEATHDEEENFNQAVADRAAVTNQLTFSGTYDMRANIAGESFTGELTLHRQEDRLRADFAGRRGELDEGLQVITGLGYPEDDLLHLCREATQQCVEVRSGPDGNYPDEVVPLVAAMRLLDVRIFSLGLTFYDEVARAINEQQVRCFIGESEAAQAIQHGEVCLTDDGLPLLVTAAGDGTTVSLTSTDVATTIDDGAFDLPYAVQGE